MEPRYNEGPTDWQNVFAMNESSFYQGYFPYIYYYWGEEYRSLYRGLRYMETRYIKVSLFCEMIILG